MTLKNRLLNRLLTPNLWVAIFCVFAVAGIICFGLGYRQLGLWLLAPLIVGGVILFLVLIPILIRANKKHPNRDKDGKA